MTRFKVAVAQLAPFYLDARATWKHLADAIREAHAAGAQLVTWGESLIPAQRRRRPPT